MALKHAKSGDLISAKPLGPALSENKSHALFKSPDLELIRLILLKGDSFDSHKVLGDITIQCIEGHLEIAANSKHVSLRAGQLVFLAGNVEHSLVAHQDSSALLTISVSTVTHAKVPS